MSPPSHSGALQRHIAAAVFTLLSGLLCFAASFARAESTALDAQRVRELARTAHEAGVSTYFLFEGDCALLFVGTEHSFDPSAPMFAVLDADWDAFGPQQVIVEGGDWPLLTEGEAQIRAYGEMGYLTWRAQANQIRVNSFEPTRAQEDASTLGPDTVEWAKLYFVLRMVPQWRSTGGLSSLAERTNAFLTAFAQRSDESPVLAAMRPHKLEEVDAMTKSLYGPGADWRAVNAHFKIAGLSSPQIQAVDRKVNALRNERLFDAIHASISAHRRTFVLAGATHLGALLPRLNDLAASCRD